MKGKLFYIALSCWVLGFIVHVMSLSGIDITSKFPFIWVLHVVAIGLFIRVVLDMKNNDEVQTYFESGFLNRMNPFALFKIIFKGVPQWTRILVMVSFLYCVVNFILFMISQHGSPGIEKGEFVLLDHGRLIRLLSEQEYHHYKANELRGFSGHWMFFFGFETAFLYKYKGIQQKNDGDRV